MTQTAKRAGSTAGLGRDMKAADNGLHGQSTSTRAGNRCSTRRAEWWGD